MHTILYAALRLRLADQIQKALCTVKNTTKHYLEAESIETNSIEHSPFLQHLEAASLPLKQIRQSKFQQKYQQIEYVSAVALKFGSRSEQSVLPFAEDLIKAISSTKADSMPRADLPTKLPCTTLLNSIQAHFSLEVMPAGWIHFRLAPSGLKVWLQALINCPLPVANNTFLDPLKSQSLAKRAGSVRNSTSVFPILHTYARCHRVLHLGQELGLIQIAPSNLSDRDCKLETGYPWQIPMPDPFPWLASSGAFRGVHAAEWQLVEEICATLDAVAQPNSPLIDKEVLKQVDRLSQSWQIFHAHCQIAGEPAQHDPARAQIRLGLTCITGKLMHYLLQSIELPTPLFL